MKVISKNAKKTPFDEFIYPESFAGAYIDEKGDYVVGYKEGFSEEDYSVLFSANLDLTIEDEVQPKVKFVKRPFSFNELNEIYELIATNMSELSVYKTFIDVKTNKVQVFIQDNKNRQPLLSFLRDNVDGFTPNKIIIQVEKNNIEYTNRKAYNGEETYYRWGLFNINKASASIGFQARDKSTNQLGIITCAHAAPAGKTMFDKGGVAIGIPSKRQQGGTIDAAFIPFQNTSSVTWVATNEIRWLNNGNLNATYYKYAAIEGYIVVGRVVTKVGIGSGRNFGEILSTNATLTVEGDYYTNVIYYSNTNKKGDSGGPVYFPESFDNYIMAVNFAGPSDGSAGYGSRVSHILGLFNLELYTIPDPMW